MNIFSYEEWNDEKVEFEVQHETRQPQYVYPVCPYCHNGVMLEVS